MAEARKILTLPGADVAAPQPPSVFDEIQSLRARLEAARGEISGLKSRLERPRGTILDTNEFARAVSDALSRSGGVGSTLARVHVRNAQTIRLDHGDEVTERVVLHVGEWLMGHVRQTDLVGRMGTTTFAVFLAFADPEAAATKMQKLVARINDAPLSHRGQGIDAQLSLEIERLGGVED